MNLQTTLAALVTAPSTAKPDGDKNDVLSPLTHDARGIRCWTGLDSEIYFWTSSFYIRLKIIEAERFNNGCIPLPVACKCNYER